MDAEKQNIEICGVKPKFNIGDDVWHFVNGESMAVVSQVIAIEFGVYLSKGKLKVIVYYITDEILNKRRINEEDCYTKEDIYKKIAEIGEEYRRKSKEYKAIRLCDL